MYDLDGIGGESPVSMSISTKRVIPMSLLPLEIISSNQSQSLFNSCLVSYLIFLSSRSTFLCASTSPLDLMKLLADVRILYKSISMSILAISVNGFYDCAGIQLLGVMSTCSILKTSPSVSSFSVKFKVLIITKVGQLQIKLLSLVFSVTNLPYRLYIYIFGFEAIQYSSRTS